MARRSAAATQAARRSPAMRQMQDAAAGWQPLSGSTRDLPAITHERMQEIAVFLSSRNPLGRRIIQAQAEWMIGEGIKVNATHPRTQELLKQWWSVNRWDLQLPQVVVELGIFGEEFAPAFFNPFSGVMKLGLLDPTWVQEVVPSPDDATIAIGVIQKPHTAGGVERRYRTLLRREDEEWLSPMAIRERERFGHGELLPTAVNKLRSATRGISDLFALADWLDGYEQLLFADLIRTKAISHYFWDYEFKGWDQDRIDDFLANLSPPRPLSVFGHNEEVQRKLVGGGEKKTETNESVRTFRNHVLGGAGQPEHWYGGGGDVNRSTADSMDGTAIKTLTARQTSLRWMIHDRAQAQIDRGIRVGYLRDEPEVREIEVVMPDLSTLDVSRISSGLQSIVNAASVGVSSGIVDRETGARFVAALGKHIGVEINAEEMLERAVAQGGEALARDLGRVYDARQRQGRGGE